jgi:predicted CoA-binding protein
MATETCEVPDHNPSDDGIRRLLEGAKTIAVVGLSDKPDRDSYRVADYLLRAGYEVFGVNPAIREALGRRCYASLSEVPGRVDIVDVFRRPEAVPAIADEAIRVGAGALWLQLGIAHTGAARKAETAGLAVVQSKCIKIEHARLLGR